MWPYEFVNTSYGVLGTLPTGEKREFATEEEYREAYRKEEDEIYDFMAEIYANEPEYPEDWSVTA